VPRLWPYCTCCTASDQSSDRFISIQTVSMDTSCNRVQDRKHDFFPQRLRRDEVSPKRRWFNDNDNDDDNDHLSQSPVSTHRYQQTVKSVPPTADAGKFRVKDAQLDQSRHNAAHKSGGTPSADGRLPGAVRLENGAAETRGTEARDAASVPRDGVALRSA
jgi:hypothetical protein